MDKTILEKRIHERAERRADDSCLPVVGIGKYGFINTFNSGFEYLSNKKRKKLLLDCVDMAMTPLDKRVEHKWNVIIGNDDSGAGSIIAWEKDSLGNGYILGIVNPHGLTFYEAIFTDEEFNDLIKYIKTLPDGEWQAKVAEHGKTEVKGELK